MNVLNRILEKPYGPLLLAFLCFITHFLFVINHLDIIGPYNLIGMWITMPEFAETINSDQTVLSNVYYRLNGWDGQWYYHIADNGYICSDYQTYNNPHKCNVGFYPGVPILASVISLTGLGLPYALPLVSQLAFFFLLYLLFRHLKSMDDVGPLGWMSIPLLASYPGALYFHTPYSESVLSLCLVSSFFLAYMSFEEDKYWVWIPLSIIAIVATLTKATGILVAGIPFLLWTSKSLICKEVVRGHAKTVFLPLATGILTIIALLSYLELNFGQWNLYFQYVSRGWHVIESSHLNLNPFVSLGAFQLTDNMGISVSNVIFVGLLPLIVLFGVFVFKNREPNQYLTLSVLAVIIIYYYFHGIVGHSELSIHRDFTRQILPSISLIVFLIISLPSRSKIHRYSMTFLFSTFLLAGLFFQNYLLIVFSIGGWVS